MRSRTAGRAWLAAILLGAALLTVIGHAIRAQAAQSSRPALRFVTVSGHAMGVAGSGWKARSKVAFSVQQIGVASGEMVRTTARGTFVIGLDRVNMCNRPMFVGVDLSGHRVVLHGPKLGCSTGASPPVPVLTTIHGKLVNPTVYRVYGLQPRSVTIRKGDELYIWEAGTTQPGFLPSVDMHFLALVDRGRTPPRACAQPDCDAGFYWQYAAVQVGQTAVDLSPACRQVVPPCEAPDFELSVDITP